jgi:hypothetical protein
VKYSFVSSIADLIPDGSSAWDVVGDAMAAPMQAAANSRFRIVLNMVVCNRVVTACAFDGFREASESD